jgi:hypothetical protein
MRRTDLVRAAIALVLGVQFLPVHATTTATGTPFYFHSGGVPVNLIDSSTFDGTAPTGGSPSLAITSGAGLSAIWTGKVGAVIETLKLNFWQYALIGEPALGEVDYDVTITVGDKDYVLPTFTEPAGDIDIPAEVTHVFAVGQPGFAAPIDATSGDVKISILGHYVDSEAVTVALYDSADYPSGFSVNGPAPATAAKPPLARMVPSSMTFSPTTIVDPQFFGSEPSIWVDQHGTVFVSAIFGFTNATSFVWRSKDGGRTFELLDAMLGPGIADPRHRPCTISGGGGDSDIVVDRTGRVYLVDLEAAGVAANYSADGGDTWDCNTLASQDTPPVEDRQWAAPAPGADGDGPAIDAYLSFLPTVAGGIELDVTKDGGKTWSFQSSYAPNVSQNGALFTYKDGTLYHAFYEGSTPYLARSDDQGKTFKLLKVAKGVADVGNDFTAADVDEAGNLYYAWVEAGSFDVLYATSKDRGEHWTKPIRLNPPASETTVFPWVAAGKKGDVAIAWYGTPTGDDPSAEPDNAAWNVWVARTLDGTSANPTFQVGRMTQTPNHFGSICLSGLGCDIPPEGDRSLGDFFEIDIAPDGTLLAAFNDNGRAHDPLVPSFPGPYVVVARQESGLGTTRSATTSSLAEKTGDAKFPKHDPSGVNVPQLDVSAPTAKADGLNLKVQFSLGDAKDLTPALNATDSGVATDAYWMAIWLGNGKREYAVLHLSDSGTEFYGGDGPGAVTREPNNEKYATYPATFAVDGTIDSATGRVTLQAPLATYGLKPNDTLSGLQIFSMTGLLSERTLLTPLSVIDMTTAVNTALTKAPVVLGSHQKPAAKPSVKKPSAGLAATGVGVETVPAVALLLTAAALAVTTRRVRIGR